MVGILPITSMHQLVASLCVYVFHVKLRCMSLLVLLQLDQVSFNLSTHMLHIINSISHMANQD